MNVIQLVVVGMVLIILATLMLAVVSYGAFRVRERGSGGSSGPQDSSGPLFFERVDFSDDSAS
jgi:hypothetical protein